MFSILLAIIYIAFISLGLPDSLLGSGWPVMQGELGVPLSGAGIVSMIIAAGTILSSLSSERLTYKLGTGLVTALSVATTAVALFGFSTANTFAALCLWAIPYGLGAGAVDAALNNYVALHFAARHMSWLHCFWGVGASISPYIMGACLSGSLGWQSGYRFVSYIQIALTAALFFTLPLWKGRGRIDAQSEIKSQAKPLGLKKTLRISGVPFVLIAFFSYCALETTTALWASSYLVEYRGIDAHIAARFASLFFLGITLGRFLNGFIADKLGDRLLIRCGIAIMALGIALVALPIDADGASLVGLIVIGLGCAPVYPSIIHATPDNFGQSNSQAIVGVQMASAYTGTTLIPPVFGWIAGRAYIGFFPFFLAIFAVLLLIMTERLNRMKPIQ